jgi:hypothetical protein
MSLFGHFVSFFEKVLAAVPFVSGYLEKRKKNELMILAVIEKDTLKMVLNCAHLFFSVFRK